MWAQQSLLSAVRDSEASLQTTAAYTSCLQLLVVRRLKTHTALKCDIYATLAKCHFVGTDTKTLKSVCNGGLKASQQVTQHDNRQVTDLTKSWIEYILRMGGSA